jgi:hypothetical protein
MILPILVLATPLVLSKAFVASGSGRSGPETFGSQIQGENTILQTTGMEVEE